MYSVYIIMELYLYVCILLVTISVLLEGSIVKRDSGCSKNLKFANGRIKYREKGRIARFRCRDDFELYGEKLIVCMGSVWSNDPPICIKKGKNCAPFFLGPHLTFKSEKFGGALVEFECSPGYAISGDAILHCDGKKWSSDMPSCKVSSIQTACDFETDMCGWIQDTNDDMDWLRNVGPTQTSGTGPKGDHTLYDSSSGHYMYMEASSPTKEGDRARLDSPIYPAGFSDSCFEFYYHMLGPDDPKHVGILEVYVQSQLQELGKSQPLFYKEGNQGDQWKYGKIYIDKRTEPFQIVIVATRMKNYVGDIAIDDVALVNCSDLNSECNTSIVCSDPYAECVSNTSGVNNTCQCKSNYRNVGEICKADLNSVCITSIGCSDPYAECMSNMSGVNNTCQCRSNYKIVGGICKADLNYVCTTSTGCSDLYAECKTTTSGANNTCQCKNNYTDISGMCKADLTSLCATSIGCSDPYAECMSNISGVNNTCQCKSNYKIVGGICKADLNSVCTTSIGCSDPYAECMSNMSGVNNTCQCRSNYKIVGGICKAVLYVETSLYFALRFTNFNFTDDLNNASSALYKQTRDTIVYSLVVLLGHFPGYREVRLLNIRKGSIIADAKVSVDETGNISTIHEGLKQAVSSGFIGTNMTVDSTYFVVDTGNGYSILDCINITGDEYSGKLVNITCMSTVVGNASPEFTWKYNGNEMDPVTGSRIGISNIIVEPNIPQRIYTTLSFSPIQSSDSGIYECAIKDQNLPKSSKNISVFVLNQPEVSIQPITKAVYAGDIVNITCQVENNVSISRMVWYRDGNSNNTSSTLPEESFHNTSQAYILTRTNISSSIVYECQGENVAGTGEKKQSNISVIFNGTTICNNEIDVKGTNWSITLPGTYDIKSCPSGMSGEAVRFCSHDGVWMDASYDNCISIKLLKLQTMTDNMKNGLVPNILPESLVQLTNVTSVELQMKEITVIGNVLDDVIQIAGKTQNITNADVENFLSTASNVIDVKNDQSWKAIIDEGKEGASIILRNVEEYSIIKAKTISSDDEPVTRYNKTNLYVEIGYKPVSDINFAYTAVNGSTLESDSSSRLFLSKDTLNKGNYTSYAGAYFRDVSRIMKVLDNKSTKETNALDINSDVMSLQLVPPPHNLNPPLTITFKHLWKNLSNPECSFLIKNASGDGQWSWSKEGCNLVSTSDHTTVCECNHLTNFAILMSPGRTPSKDQVSLSIISTVGCAISIFCLSVTMIAHFIVWRHVKSDRAIILMNLCLALIISYIIFLAGADHTEHKNVCIAVAALLHYFYLVVFFLMLAYGMEIAITVTTLFERKSRVRWLLVMAWFLPGVIVVISLAATKLEGYGNEQFCWLSVDGGLIWAFVGPAALVILVGFIIIISVFRLMFSTSAMRKKTDMSKAKTTIRSLCVLLPVTGITWVFGILSVNEDLVIFQYLFAITNSLQGFFIFQFHCFYNNQLRTAIKQTGDKRKRSKISTSSSLKGRSIRTLSIYMAESDMKTSHDHTASQMDTDLKSDDRM